MRSPEELRHYVSDPGGASSSPRSEIDQKYGIKLNALTLIHDFQTSDETSREKYGDQLLEVFQERIGESTEIYYGFAANETILGFGKQAFLAGVRNFNLQEKKKFIPYINTYIRNALERAILDASEDQLIPIPEDLREDIEKARNIPDNLSFKAIVAEYKERGVTAHPRRVRFALQGEQHNQELQQRVMQSVDLDERNDQQSDSISKDEIRLANPEDLALPRAYAMDGVLPLNIIAAELSKERPITILELTDAYLLLRKYPLNEIKKSLGNKEALIALRNTLGIAKNEHSTARSFVTRAAIGLVNFGIADQTVFDRDTIKTIRIKTEYQDRLKSLGGRLIDLLKYEKTRRYLSFEKHFLSERSISINTKDIVYMNYVLSKLLLTRGDDNFYSNSLVYFRVEAICQTRKNLVW